MGQLLFGDKHEPVFAGHRTGQQNGIFGRAQPVINMIQLEPRRTVAGQSKIADDLIFDAIEHPVIGRIGRDAPVRIAKELALRGKSDPDEVLRRAAIAPPEPAIGTVESVVIFARLRGPGANAILGPADFQHAVVFGMDRDAPVEPVAPEIDQVATAVAIIPQGIKRLGGVIFRVGARGHSRVARDGRHPLAMQFAVRHDVIGDTLGM